MTDYYCSFCGGKINDFALTLNIDSVLVGKVAGIKAIIPEGSLHIFRKKDIPIIKYPKLICFPAKKDCEEKLKRSYLDNLILENI